jgi:hypothetical protein
MHLGPSLWTPPEKISQSANNIREDDYENPNGLGVTLAGFPGGAIYEHPQPKGESK